MTEEETYAIPLDVIRGQRSTSREAGEIQSDSNCSMQLALKSKLV